MAENEMKQIRIEKVTVNIGIGQVGEDVQQAKNLLEQMTGSQAVTTESSDAAQSFGMRPGLNVGAKTTLRGDNAREFLGYVFEANDNKMPAKSFDTQGNFSIGVEEYINMPNMKYNPDIGMQGFDVAVTLERPGYRVKNRKNGGELSEDHRISPEEAQEFIKDEFGVEIV